MDEKLKQIKLMLFSLEDAVKEYQKKLSQSDLSKDEDHRQCDFLRDSVTQRLEYTIEGFWKYLKTYMEIKQGILLKETAPMPITRTAVLHRLITEEEASQLVETIKQRNKTSHIYKEEIADEVAKYAPEALVLMKTITERLATRCKELQ